MSSGTHNEYLRNAVMTASPEQLHLMLYDGAIRFARKAREGLAKKNFEVSCENILKAEKIILELDGGLKHEISPVLCEQMAALYNFVYRKLVDANLNRDTASLDEAIQILDHQRETWRLLIEKLKTQQASPAAANPSGANPPTAAALATSSTENVAAQGDTRPNAGPTGDGSGQILCIEG